MFDGPQKNLVDEHGFLHRNVIMKISELRPMVSTPFHARRLVCALLISTLFPLSSTVARGGGNENGAWPPTRKDNEGMIWYWSGRNHGGIVVDADDNWVRDGQGLPRRGARHAWFGGIEPHDGFLEAADAAPALAEVLENTRQFHVEMSLLPPMDGPAAGTLFWMGNFEMETLWVLRLHDDGMLRAHHGEAVRDLLPLKADNPVHLGFSFDEKETVVWINGRSTLRLEENILPEIEDRWDLIVGFGGGAPNLQGWRGAMEHLALYAAPTNFEANEIAWRDKIAARTPPEWIEVEAELVAEATRPDPDQMTDYGEALLGRIWRPVDPAQVPENMRAGFFTWQWLYLDNQFLETAAQREPGTRKALVVSLADKHPQLEEIQQVIEGLDPMDFLEMESFFLQDPAPTERDTP